MELPKGIRPVASLISADELYKELHQIAKSNGFDTYKEYWSNKLKNDLSQVQIHYANYNYDN